MTTPASADQQKHPIRVLQLTDPHLMADAEGRLVGVNTRESLDAVIALALEEQGQPDLIIASGDIAQDGSEEAYRVFRDKMTAFTCPVIWFPGNHDDSMAMTRVIGGSESAARRLFLGGWQLVFLDSSVPGAVHGRLGESELTFLEQSLQESPDTPTLVALHHHPVDIRCDWMSAIGLEDGDELMGLVTRYPQVKVVLWGHIHQAFDEYREGVRLLATPSTCIQFEPGASQFSIDERAPGYRWLELYDNGSLETDVRRASAFEVTVDLDSDGY